MCTLRRKDHKRLHSVRPWSASQNSDQLQLRLRWAAFFNRRLIREKTQTFTLNGETNLRILGLSMLPRFLNETLEVIMATYPFFGGGGGSSKHQQIIYNFPYRAVQKCFNEVFTMFPVLLETFVYFSKDLISRYWSVHDGVWQTD